MRKIKLFKGYPRAYKRNAMTKLLYLYKINVVTIQRYEKARKLLVH